jgi:hypothetical protein
VLLIDDIFHGLLMEQHLLLDLGAEKVLLGHLCTFALVEPLIDPGYLFLLQFFIIREDCHAQQAFEGTHQDRQ